MSIPAIILVFGFVLYRQFQGAEHFRMEVERSHQRSAQIQSLLSALKDLETGQRGYLITGQERFLEPYRDGDRQIDRTLAKLDSMMSNDEDAMRDLAMLKRLSADKQAFADRAVELQQSGDRSSAMQAIASGEGKRSMDAIRALAGHMLDQEAVMLKVASRELETASRQMQIVAYSLLSALLLLLIASSAYIFRAMEARRIALAKWHDASRRREAILNSAMDAILTLNPSGTIESVNSAALDMFGYPQEDLVRRDVGRLFDPPAQIGVIAQALKDLNIEPGRPGEMRELRLRRQDGSRFPSDVAISAMQLESGISYVAVVRDITERKRVEQLKSEFVSTVSHELRTPLTSISGALGLLAGGAAGEIGAKPLHLIEIARKNCDRLVRLINDILDIEKIASGRMRFENRDVGLHEIVAEAMAANQGFADGFGVHLSLTGGAGLMVHADPDRLNQVVTNLVSNAVKFSPPDGTVEVVIEPGPVMHRISVRDHGDGIPEAFRSRIFDKFAQADASDSKAKGGTGLGLSIVREIVTRMSGRVSFESEEGSGTIFHVDLPNAALELAPIAHSRRSILLVGGHGSLFDGLGSELSGKGIAISNASDPRNALEILAKRSFTAVLLLLDDPSDAESGEHAHFRARLAEQQIPVISIHDAQDMADAQSNSIVVLDLKQRPPSVDALIGAVNEMARSGEHRPRVLHVDDDPDILNLVATALADHALVLSTRSIAAARAVLRTSPVDLAILDLALEDGCGAELIPDLERREGGAVQTIIFSAQDCDDQTARAVSAHFVKASTPLSRLVEAVEHLAERRRSEASEASEAA
ncbi:MAG: CHASE3 domain-containing protein [Novosphingobium sp.]|nr:CHASE3 domain-containing protein [Novosphingobium sp.]